LNTQQEIKNNKTKWNNMKLTKNIGTLLAVSLLLSLKLTSQAEDQAQSQANVQQQNKQLEKQARPEVEKQRKEAEQQTEKTLDRDATAAIEETQKAVKAIGDNKTDEALAAIEQATGKINILLARNPATGLIPVSFEVEVIDLAPLDTKTIKAHVTAAELAVSDKDYPAARALLDGLTSEIRSRTYNLPLATYPVALKDAARLLDQKNTKEAKIVLLAALNTLAVIDTVRPLPIALAQEAINEAQSLRDNDKNLAQKLLATARNELDRAKELGYAGKAPEYASLDKTISDLDKQLKGNSDTASAFTKLKNMVSNFFSKQSQNKRG
jgi:hypothetical protein